MKFSEIKGQDRAIKILRQAMANNHLAQTYLFHGPDGVGKREVARTFAMSLNCDANEAKASGPERATLSEVKNDACGLCISCRKVEQGIHPDVVFVQHDKGEIKIGSIREIINGMVYRPLEGKKRVVIVDGADRLNISASNAFLKTLEEPPVETIIILISSSPDMLPQTVLSRCHKVSFGNIPTEAVADILMQKKGLTQTQAESVASLADGSLSKAMALSSSDVQRVREDIMAGLTINKKERGMIFDMAERFSGDEEMFYDALYWIYSYFRDILILKSLKSWGDSTLLINKDLHSHLLPIKDRMTIDGLLDIIGFIQFIYRGRERNINRQLALDVLGIKINNWSGVLG